MNHASVTRSLHQRGVLVCACVMGAVCMALWYTLKGYPAAEPSIGLVRKWSGTLHLTPDIAMAIGIAATAGIMLLMAYLNKAYNLLRRMSLLHCTLFVFIEAATPVLIMAYTPGPLLCGLVLTCMALLLYAHGHNLADTRKVFLVFALLSAATAVEYAAIVYIPVFILACFQLHLFSLRALWAILIGIFTPWVIFFGFGVLQPHDVEWPTVHFHLPLLTDPHTILFIATTALSIGLAMIALLQNLIKIISYNAQARATQSVITTSTIITVIAAVVDYPNIYAYLTLLNCLAAFQLTHMFVAIHNFAKSYMAIVGLIIMYLALYALKLIA